jgi:hypothetical protein
MFQQDRTAPVGASTKRPSALRVSICSPTEGRAAFPGAKYFSTRWPRCARCG